MSEQQSNLRNEDFRKLLSSSVRRPAAAESSAKDAATPSTASAASFRHKQKQKYTKKPKTAQQQKPKKEEGDPEEDDESILKDILRNYRDRAAERRKQGGVDDDAAKLAAAYRAVPGDSRAVADKEDLRKQAILESKYLGGDMEHTHLVKGLDYSLLNKVRSEITKDDNVDDDDFERALEEGPTASRPQASAVEVAQSQSENRMVRAMHRILFKNELPVRNELFAKGRMAYVVELEDEDADIPTTLLRSLHDCPRSESLTTINANNLLISKLTQVLAYLRTDNKKKRRELEALPKVDENPKSTTTSSKAKGESIYDEEGDYVPHRERERDRDRDRDRRDKERDRHDRSYFDSKDRDREKRRDDTDRSRKEKKDREDRRQREKEQEKERKEQEEKEKEKRLEEKMEKRRKEAESGGYDECYPGGMAEVAGGWDSDEEDFTKMDIGNRKGPVKRWDFENDGEYEKYQGAREALPKAAYQYGVKTGDGRKTRKTQAANDAKKIDRELEKINRIMEKRKTGGEPETAYKKPKY